MRNPVQFFKSLVPKINCTFIRSNSYKYITAMSSSGSDSQDGVLFEENDDNKGIIILNRPKALNALSIPMLTKIYSTLIKWEKDKSLVIVKSAGGKAFCAGGDVKLIAHPGFKRKKLGRKFFRVQYTTNGLIGSYKIPYVALIDGIVMGGGVGLSVHGQYRVATEKTLFAMPETRIGLFPDVGASYFLPKLKRTLGVFLGLTEYRLKGGDVVKAGIATHFCDSSDLPALEKTLLECLNIKDIKNTLAKFNKIENKQFRLEPYLGKIEKIFSAPTVEEIYGRLNKDRSKWAQETLNTLNKMSPTSLKITLKELELGKNMSLKECLNMEYRLAVNCIEGHDFQEGVRALLLNRDQNPQWNPITLEEVSEDVVNKYFRKFSGESELSFDHKL